MQNAAILLISLCFTLLTMSCSRHQDIGETTIPRLAALADLDSTSQAQLDSIYPSAIAGDAATSVFATAQQQDSLATAWPAFLIELCKHLDSTGFPKTSNIACFIKLYCAPSGHIDHLFYEFEEV